MVSFDAAGAPLYPYLTHRDHQDGLDSPAHEAGPLHMGPPKAVGPPAVAAGLGDPAGRP